MIDKSYCVYIATNKINTVVYIGVTNNLIRRMYEHKNKLIDGFTKKYRVDKLIYYELTTNIYSAIEREKQLKGGSRKKKEQLVESINPEWRDLYEEIASSSNSSQ